MNRRSPTRPDGFNPSVGILFIQAPSLSWMNLGFFWFQSLGRDSVHSSPPPLNVQGMMIPVSIPRSGFCSFKLGLGGGYCCPIRGFNPSVGILFIQACLFHQVEEAMEEFQSLGRDSVHSSHVHHCHPASHGQQFQSLGRDSVHSSFRCGYLARAPHVVSIPRSGFCSFKLTLDLDDLPDGE